MSQRSSRLTRRALLQGALGLAAAGLRLEAVVSAAQTGPPVAGEDLVGLVNPLQGADADGGFSRGNTVPRITRPWGMTNWSPQDGTGENWFFDRNSHRLQGIRATHQPSPWMGDYGNFTIMAQSGALAISPDARASAYRPEDLDIHPHFLSVRLQRDNVRLEVAPTERCAIFRLTFPSGQPARVLIDAHTSVEIGADGRTITGRSRSNRGGVSGDFACFFAAVFDPPFTRAYPTQKGVPLVGQTQLTGEGIGAVAEFGARTPVVTMKIGTSFLSAEQARRNLDREIGERGFDAVRQEAAAAWADVLGRVRVSGGTLAQRRTFYSCLYRAHHFPRMLHEYDAAGQAVHYSPYDGGVHPGVLYTDSGFWDTYRTVFPLLSLLHPERLGEMIQGFVNAYREGGWLPQWPSPGYRAVMIGTHIDSVIADACVKGIGGFDREAAYAGLLKDADTPGDPHDRYGRVGLADYLAKGYVPADHADKATARSLDYFYDDFCISQVADVLGRTADRQRLRGRAQGYRRLYDADLGFLWGKKADGAWLPDFDQYAWGGPYVEGGPWQSTWAVPHDPAGLMALMGGQRPFLQKLDRLLLQPPTFHVGTYGGVIHEMAEMGAVPFGQYDQGNQPVHLALYLFTAAGCPWKTQYWTRRVLDTLYSPDNYPGDEDNGEMASWYVLNALGVYPLCPGHPSYVFGSPLFPEARLTLAGGKTLRLSAPANSAQNVYVNHITRNGKTHTALWITHRDLVQGGVIEFTMARRPAARPLAATDFPFSMSAYEGMAASTDLPDTAIRINCGGDAIGPFVGDCFFEGGQTARRDNTVDATPAHAAPADVYQSERYGSFVYRIPLPMLPGGRDYRVRLHFAEIADDGAGKRLMDIRLNGRNRLSRYDLFAEVGMNKAAVKDFLNIRPDQDGAVTVAISASPDSPDGNAKISAIEVVAMA